MIAFETFAASLYDIPMDVQFVIPIVYTIAFFLAALLHKFAPKIPGIILGLLFMMTFSYWWYLMLADNDIFKWVIPGIIVFGTFSGLFGWVKTLLDKFKKLGNDDSYLS